ncbi:hypothetical protein ACNI65_18665 [Roseateles sp. So40a]|uniref:hypothetical protein n=1 Tax=Roseateles sp. So40a TaxID=3400226 RepID=UPI003A881694
MKSIVNPPDDWIEGVAGTTTRMWIVFGLFAMGMAMVVYTTATQGWRSAVVLAILMVGLQLSVLGALRKVLRRTGTHEA